MLALSHLSIRYPAGVLRDEAREIFANTVVPRDFDEICVPFAERGEPELIRWSDRVRDLEQGRDSDAVEVERRRPAGSEAT